MCTVLLGHGDTYMYVVISHTMRLDEIRFAMATAGKGKALGCDDIPLEVLQSEQCSRYLLTLYNCCFSKGSIPEIWSRGIINPILKDPSSDSRNTLIIEALQLHPQRINFSALFCIVDCQTSLNYIMAYVRSKMVFV